MTASKYWLTASEALLLLFLGCFNGSKQGTADEISPALLESLAAEPTGDEQDGYHDGDMIWTALTEPDRRCAVPEGIEEEKVRAAYVTRLREAAEQLPIRAGMSLDELQSLVQEYSPHNTNADEPKMTVFENGVSNDSGYLLLITLHKSNCTPGHELVASQVRITVDNFRIINAWIYFDPDQSSPPVYFRLTGEGSLRSLKPKMEVIAEK